MTCDAQGLIGRDMFAIDGVKLASNASKERSGIHEELRHRVKRLDRAAEKILELHQTQDKCGDGAVALEPKRQARIDALRKEAARTREFLSTAPKRQGSKGKELKSNVTDPDSAKMATCKGVMQGYAAQVAVGSANQIIIAADVIGSGSEQAMLLPMIEQAAAYRTPDTLITADAGYHSDANIAKLMEQSIPAMVADNQMRARDERFESQDKYKGKCDPLPQKKATGQDKEVKRFRPTDFTFNDDNTATGPAGQLLRSPGTIYTTARGLNYQSYTAKATDCESCPCKKQCLKGPMKPNDGRGRQVTRFEPKPKDNTNPSERMRQAIDSPIGRQLYSQRFGVVEPVFANIRHNKRLTRLKHRGSAKVNTQWNLYWMVHNIEKLAKTSTGQKRTE